MSWSDLSADSMEFLFMCERGIFTRYYYRSFFFNGLSRVEICQRLLLFLSFRYFYLILFALRFKRWSISPRKYLDSIWYWCGFTLNISLSFDMSIWYRSKDSSVPNSDLLIWLKILFHLKLLSMTSIKNSIKKWAFRWSGITELNFFAHYIFIPF